MTQFSDLGLSADLLKTVETLGYKAPTPIQAQAIPHLLDKRDLLGIAQTGTGKTAAFALPTLHRFAAEPKARTPKSARALILSPTRELASQIAESFAAFAKGRSLLVETVFGGVKIPKQIRAMKGGVDVLVATPGRLVDLMGQGAVTLSGLDTLILDEADQMLDLGFAHDLKKIMAQVPKERQTLLFSATMPDSIAELGKRYLKDPVTVSVTPQSTTAERVQQGVLHVDQGDKPDVLSAILTEVGMGRVLVFTRTKHGADRVVKKLTQSGVEAAAIHGNKSQPQRERALAAFKDGRTPVLVATDIAARGIDISGIDHVVNYEMPNVAEQYVHRIGRTARAGREGFAVSLVAPDELYYLRDVEKTTGQQIPVLPAPEGCEKLILPTPDPKMRVAKPKGPAGRQPRRGGGGGGNAGGRQQKPAASSGKPPAKKARPRRRAARG